MGKWHSGEFPDPGSVKTKTAPTAMNLGKPAIYGGPGEGQDGRGAYRYTLWRSWSPSEQGDLLEEQPARKPGFVQFIGLNPSTATEEVNDPTVKRCMSFAAAWGYDEMVMSNLFAFRATDPKDMKAHPEPIGAENNEWLKTLAESAALVICAWGAHGPHASRDKAVIEILRDIRIFHLGTTSAGHPRHPLYLRAITKPRRFWPASPKPEKPAP
jgi:hypothetical protein